MTKFEHAGNLMEAGKEPGQALAEAKLTYAELLEFLYYHCQSERIGDMSTILLESWLRVVPSGVNYESGQGHFAEARRLLDLERRIAQELLRRR